MTAVDRWQFWALAVGSVVGIHLLTPSAPLPPSLLGESVERGLSRVLFDGGEWLCRGSVLDRLKTPSVATFGAHQVDYDSKTGNAFITGEVTSQNGFGAMLRGTYACRLAREGSEWRVRSVAID